MGKTILRVICLITFTIAMYRTDILNMALFLLVMGIIFWGLPAIYSFIFDKGKQYDGICFIDEMSEKGTRIKMDIFNPMDVFNKKELSIKVDIPIEDKDIMPIKEENGNEKVKDNK